MSDDLNPMIMGIAAEFGRKHHTHGADSSDFAQEMYLWLVENAGKVDKWLHSGEYETKHGERMLAKALRNRCKGYALEVRGQGHFLVDELYFYTKGEVKNLLGAMFDREAWLEPPQSDGRSTKAPAHGGNWMATLADISRAYDRLDRYDRDLLARFHRDDRSNKALADSEGISEALMSYRHDRAIRRLHEHLGGDRPEFRRDPWQGRHAVSNAHAQAMTSSTYED